MKSRVCFPRLIGQSLPFLAVIGFAFLIPAVTASGPPLPKEDSPAPLLSAPSAVYSPADEARKTRRGDDLPGKRHGLRLDPRQISYELGPLAAGEIERRAPNQIGRNRALGLLSKTLGVKVTDSDGSKIRILAITSPGAKALRVHFSGFDLADGDEVYVYGHAEDGPLAGPYAGRGPLGDGDFWAEITDGDIVVIEHHIKGRERGFLISEVAHIYADLQEGAVTPQVLDCEIDASCDGGELNNAVGRIILIDGGGVFVCTGTMVNNLRGDFTPLFLTAAHCVATEEVARTAQIIWFYQTTHCNSGSLRRDIAISGEGATLLATSQAADSTLLKVRGPIPSGVVYSGWDPTPRGEGARGIGLHHPGGGVPPSMASFLRIARGRINGAFNCGATGLMNGYFVEYTSGTVEPGSSGSGLFDADGQGLVGVLSCGPANPACFRNGFLYGKFSDFYPVAKTFFDQGAGGVDCVESVAPTQQTFGINGGAGSVSVTAAPTCAWTAISNVSWITITSGSSGTGSGVASYAVAANPTGNIRNGIITIQGKPINISQEGINCNYALAPQSQSFPGFGGAGNVTVTAPTGCNWAAARNASWITIASGGTGDGNGTFTYTVAANLGSTPRNGRITVGGQALDISQGAGPVITGAAVSGKRLIVTGVNFASGAELFIDGVKQKKTKNDAANPTTALVAKKSGKKIAAGQRVILQVRNPDGNSSQEFSYAPPAAIAVGRR